MNKQIIVYEPNEQVRMEVKTDGETSTTPYGRAK